MRKTGEEGYADEREDVETESRGWQCLSLFFSFFFFLFFPLTFSLSSQSADCSGE